MNNPSVDLDSARDILKTYREVNDPPNAQAAQQANQQAQSKLHQKNKELENELSSLKEKYKLLQKQMIDTEEKKNREVEKLNRKLLDNSHYTAKLQEDFENAIYQLTNRDKKD